MTQLDDKGFDVLRRRSGRAKFAFPCIYIYINVPPFFQKNNLIDSFSGE